MSRGQAKNIWKVKVAKYTAAAAAPSFDHKNSRINGNDREGEVE